MHLLFINLITDSLPAIALSMNDKEKGIMKQKPRDPKDGIFAHGGLKFTLFYGAVIFIITALAFFLPVLQQMGETSYWSWSFEGLYNCMASSNGAGQFVGVKYVGGQYVHQLFETEQALNDAQFSLGYLNVHEQGQTFAFTVLAMAQIFHMIGMTDIKHSFINIFKGKNWMLLVAFVFGFAMQVLVTEVDAMNLVFTTTHLQWFEWFELLGFAIIPLVVHEIAAPIFRKKNVQII